jgi:hypothetical protein
MISRLVRFFAIVALFYLHLGHAQAQERVDALVITALDVSGSINDSEITLQVNGMAQALLSPAFLHAATAGPNHRIGFLVFLWANSEYPELVSWTVIGGAADAEKAAAALTLSLQSLIKDGPVKGGPERNLSSAFDTNLSGALDYAAAALQAAPWPAERRVVNIVGNGEDNVGEGPLDARGRLIAINATINGVVVGNDAAVRNYYQANVIGGKGAFCLTASRAEDLTTVLVAKFVLDLAFLETAD